MLYLSEPKNSDFARLTIFPLDTRASLYIKEGKAIETDEGVRLLMHLEHLAQEYGSKEVNGKKLTIESHPHVFVELHDKEWIKKGYQNNPDTTVKPTDVEIYLCHLFKSSELANGFKGQIHIADYTALIELVQAGSIEIEKVHERMAQLESVELSDAFKTKKEPPVYGKGGQKGGYTAKSEGDKAKERAEFIRTFLDPTSADGFFSGKYDDAVALIYGKDAPTGYLESFVRLILP